MMESGCEFMKCEYAARDVDNNPVCKYEKGHCRYKCIEREMQQLHDVCQIEMKSVFDTAEARIADLQAALATANQERDELKAEIADMKKHTWCAYCGHEILIDDDLATKISEHIMTCEKHPLHIALAALAAAQGDNGKLREVIETMILFIPDGWQMPLGWNQVVAQAQEALGGNP